MAITKLTNTQIQTLVNTAYKQMTGKEASDLILTKYEMPADQSESVKDYRARKGLNVYSYYVGDKNNLVRNYLNEAQALISKALDILN